MTGNEDKYVVRQMQSSDCVEVLKIWETVSFLESKYMNDIYLKIDPDGLFVAQEIVSGIISIEFLL